MNSRTHNLLTGLGRFVRCLTLVLLPALVAEGGQTGSACGDPAGPPPESSPQSKLPYSSPYLAVVGPPPMRFREPPAPPSFELEPVAAGPAQLEENMQASPPAVAGGRSDSSSAMAASSKSPSRLSSKSPSSSATNKDQEESDPSPILPDDMRRDVRPEDLLPYFQYPRNGGAVIGVPVPAQPAQPTLPPSSATYRQQ